MEMGADRPGDITKLCEIAKPDYGVITNIGAGHLEKLGTIEEVAKTKSALFTSLSNDGIRFLNADESRLTSFSKEKNISFGVKNAADFVGKITETGLTGCISIEVKIPDSRAIHIKLHVPGAHQIYNVLAAVAVGHHLRIDADRIRTALENYTTTGRRMRIFEHEGKTIIDDTYNANPDSMRAAINTLASISSDRKVAVLSDMLELGSFSEQLHREIGSYLKSTKIDAGFLWGSQSRYTYEAAKGMDVNYYENKNELATAVKKFVKSGDAILVKGSRGMKMEEIVEAL